MDLKNEIATDLTGAFPTISIKGNRYVFIIYEYDSNLIWSRGMKNQQAATIKNTYEELFNLLTLRGLRPKLQRLDNEVSIILTNYMY